VIGQETQCSGIFDTLLYGDYMRDAATACGAALQVLEHTHRRRKRGRRTLSIEHAASLVFRNVSARRRDNVRMRLRDKTCIVTGAASGIGRGAALRFAEEGAHCILVDVDGARLAEVALELETRATPVVADIAASAGITVIAQTVAARGRVDVLFNNAGIMSHGDFLDFSDADWDRVLAVNVTAMKTLARLVVPLMLNQGGGSIINTSSVMATLTEPGYEAYTTSKAAIIGFSKALAVSYAEQRIRVNALCPGWVDTPMNQKLAEELGGVDKLYPIIKQQQPTGRMASIREIANVALFLASDESSAVTGSALYADGASTAAI
jgi:NAD(P)-dependent dehydrogenase (short-subunit alcohol dehydrogenase family)